MWSPAQPAPLTACLFPRSPRHASPAILVPESPVRSEDGAPYTDLLAVSFLSSRERPEDGYVSQNPAVSKTRKHPLQAT